MALKKLLIANAYCIRVTHNDKELKIKTHPIIIVAVDHA